MANELDLLQERFKGILQGDDSIKNERLTNLILDISELEIGKDTTNLVSEILDEMNKSTTHHLNYG